jgi:Zn-dependent protease
MRWNDYAVFALLGLGAIGFVLMTIAFVLIIRQGSFKSLQQSDAAGRWPLPRRLMLVGAMLGMLFGLGVAVLGVIPGGLPWRD